MSRAVESVAVVGGGLAGLSCGALLAREGIRVTVLEAASRCGGRARTDDHEGFKFNVGPHALYVDGAARRLLKELGVPFEGHPPPAKGLWAVREGELHLLPQGPVALFRTSLLGVGEKLAVGKLLGGLPKVDPAPWHGRSVREWIDAETSSPGLVGLLEALARLT
ncbi:MAG: FAD-dependent oxidoreductase, partial [Thermoanaerobaculia bacterium]|nr:FAD-dependent oxidoreductase [Thermoanaerobaculia bacterium]